MQILWNYNIGGLVAIGLCSKNHILAVTHSGSGLIDIDTGHRFARKYFMNYPCERGISLGIALYSGEEITMNTSISDQIEIANKLSERNYFEDHALVIKIPKTYNYLVGFSDVILRVRT